MTPIEIYAENVRKKEIADTNYLFCRESSSHILDKCV